MSETDATTAAQMQCIVLALYFVFRRLVSRRNQTKRLPPKQIEREREIRRKRVRGSSKECCMHDSRETS